LILHATMLRALRLIRVQDAGFGIRRSGCRAGIGATTMLWMALGEGWSFEMATSRGGGLRGFGVWRVEGVS
jgi:hypothetical protein